MFDWRNNLLEYLANFVEHEVSQTIQNKDFNPDRFFQVLNQKSVRFINHYDFASLKGQIPLDLLDFSDAHRTAIEDFITKIAVGLPEFAYFLKLLSKILCDFETAQGIAQGEEYAFETLEARVIYEVYDFVKALFKQKFPNKAIELEQRIAHKTKLETEVRPSCPECSSTKVISYGNKWLCNDCHRSWVKVSRRKQKLLEPS